MGVDSVALLVLEDYGDDGLLILREALYMRWLGEVD